MTTSSLVFVLALVAGGLAAPRLNDLPRCSTECPVTGSPKLAYEPGKTYTYAYSGKSKVQLKGVEDGETEIDWAGGVDLTWISPCDVAISFNKMKMQSPPGPDAAEIMERYPMVVAVADGRVQHVCAHPEDLPWAINLKKGIASAIQNSIPSLSEVSSGMTITETDVVGKCPTKYEIETEGEKVIVVKEKNHRHCHEHYPTPAETPAPWMKAPLPIQEAKSECKQEITNGIYTAITCEDKHIVRPALGLYKHVEANQVSTLRFISKSSDTSAINAIVRGDLKRESLLYNHETTKYPELAPQVDEVMREICEKTKTTVETDAAALVAKALHLLRHVPEAIVEEVAEKVRRGTYCRDSAKLESIFLDAVAFLHESGAVKVMVQEIEQGRATGGRLALYTAALYLTPRPNIEAVKALIPLFESHRPVPSVMLAAASMVKKYCRFTPNCHQETPVERIAEILATKVERHCSPSVDEESEEEVIATLKALGNMGVFTPTVERAAINCIEEHEVKTSIRVAAAHSFRQANCYRPAVEKLVDIALRPTFETEVRITSYLAAIRCAEMEDLEKIFEKITEEENTQVRGFILGHLMNIQESTCPTKENLRYLLTNFVIPTDFERDFRKFSRNVDMSYHSPSFGLGAGVESNIIYAPGSFVPRAVTVNLRADLDETPMDIAEIGARFEGIDSIIEELVGPEGYLRKASFGKIMDDITGFAEEKGLKVMEHIQRTLRTRRSIDINTISEFFDKLYGDKASRETRAEVFARFMGHEVAYANLGELFKDITSDRLIETLFTYFEDSLEHMKNLNFNTARTAQFNMDYSLPTIQGAPFKLQLTGTAVGGLEMEGNFNIAQIISNLGNLNTNMKLLPSLSVEVKGFVGFECHLAKVGIEMENTISSANGASINIKTTEGEKIEVELELPEKMELINIKSHTYLVKTLGEGMVKVTPSSMRDRRIKRESCIDTVEPMLGLKMCYEMNIPDIIRSNSLPLGEPIVAKFFIEKSDPSMKGFIMTAAIRNRGAKKLVKINLEAAGSSTPRQAELTLSYNNERASHIISAELESSSIAAGIWTTLTNDREYLALETFAKLKSGEFDIARGIKIDYKVDDDGIQGAYEMNVYTGRSKRFTPETNIIEARYMRKMNRATTHTNVNANVDFLFKTKNALAEYMNLDVEVGIDFDIFSLTDLIPLKPIPNFKLAYPMNLRKMEVNGGFKNYKLTSFVRGGQENDLVRQHLSTFKLAKGRREIISFEGTHKLEGRITGDLIIKNEATIKMGSAPYKVMYDVFYHTEKMGISFEVSKENANVKIAEMEAVYTRSGEEHKTRFLVEIPGYIRPVKVEAKLEEESEDRYNLEAAVKHGERMLFEASGPVVVRFSSKIAKLQANVKLTTFASESYFIGTNLVFANKKQLMAIEIKQQEEPVFGAEWKMAKESSEKTTVSTAFVLPALIEYKLDAVITGELVHVSFNNLVLPKTSSRRRVKGFVDVHIAEKKANVEFAWNADKNPSEKLSMDAALISSTANPGYAEIHGNIIFMGEPHHLKMEVTSTNLLKNLEGENRIKIILTTSAQKTVILDAHSNIEWDANAIKVATNFGFKNMEGHEYKLGHQFGLKIEGPLNFVLEGKMHFVTPEGETKFETALTHHRTSEEHIVSTKVGVETPSLKMPVMVVFSIHNTEESYTGVCKMERNTPLTILEWELKSTPEGGLEAVEAGFDMKAVVELLKIVRTLVALEEERIGHMTFFTERTSYRYHFARKTPTTYSLQVETPSRTMAGEAKHSPSETGLKFYPNKDHTEVKYELGYKAKHEERWGERTSRWEVHANHPSMPKPIQVAVQYTAAEDSVKGTVELDIFPEHENKITGTLETQRIAENAFKTDIILSGRILHQSPKITLVTAYAPDTIALDVLLHKTATEAPIGVISAKYDKTTATTATMALTVEMEERPVFGFTAAMEPEKEPSCDGFNVRGFVFSSAFGKYDVISKMCSPAFVEVITKRQGGEKEYITKLGHRCPDTAEVGVYIATGELEERRGVAVASVKLASPTLVDVEMILEAEAYEVMAEFSDVAEKVMKGIEESAMELFRFLEAEAAAKGIHFPSSQFATMLEEVKEEIRVIYHEMILTEAKALNVLIRDIIESPSVSYISRVYFEVWSNFAHFQKALTNHIVEEIKKFGEFENIPEAIKEFVMEVVQMVETGELPAMVREILEEIEDTKVYKMIKAEIDTLVEEYPEEYEAIKVIVTKVFATLERDVEILSERIMEVPAVRRIIHWIIHHFSPDYAFAEEIERVASGFLEEFLFVSMETSGNRMKIQIPLHRPLYSLSQVVQEAEPNPVTMLNNIIWAYIEYIPMPVEDLIWTYYNFVPCYINEVTALLPPYPRVAMVVGGTEVLTFDGLVVRAPRSPCKVLLAAHGHHRIMMSHPQATAPPQLELKTPEATIVIKPNFQVLVNGRPMTNSEETIGKVRIENKAEHIEIGCPLMKVIAAKTGEVVAIEASGWTFGHVAGLLGPNNGEIGDDLLMPNGEYASNPRELVAAWQEDEQCSTPEIPRSETSVSRMVQCEAFLGIRSRCNPVVRPEPFIEMCHAAHDVCDAAKAYRTICALKGVEEIFSMTC